MRVKKIVTAPQLNDEPVDDAQPDDDIQASPTERRCIITGEGLEPHQLIRFVADGDGFIFPDVGGKAQSRGAYIKAERDILEKAITSGQLQKSLEADHIADDMPAIVEKLLVKRCQDHIAMARRSGIAIGGGGKIRSLGDVTGLLIASDASDREARALRGDVDHDWIISVLASHEIGVPFGRQALAFAAILPSSSYGTRGQAESLSRELRRLATYRQKRDKKSARKSDQNRSDIGQKGG